MGVLVGYQHQDLNADHMIEISGDVHLVSANGTPWWILHGRNECSNAVPEH